ncbi:MAG TPA: 1,2-phenylacetyl-CoA epoxidase subunit PaaD [Micromonosporaceae bacterium]|nr:1,2-phenylacetyl-CoA epoxidase subunit PaaD [Micromonosporaceae bacterium]
MVTAQLRRVAGSVVDPELRAVTIEELGILRDVGVDPDSGRVVVTITPTYAGCPAMDTIRADIRQALAVAGHPDAEVRTVLSPAWSTDRISEAGRAKLAAAGIAPPGPAGGGPGPGRGTAGPVALALSVRCPRCGSPQTEQLSRFGSTACKALWRCRACLEPFEHIKAL